jgi:glycine/D-amino acid oxidase-like deaminating enzyme
LEPQAHTGSYYAATVNNTTQYAPLRGDQHADVCVIGAGFSGISTALHLAERGYDVSVVEANRVGWGASGRNGGQIIGGISGEELMARHLGDEGERILWEMRWAGHDIIRERVQTYGIDCDLKWGYLDVAIKQRHLDHQQEEIGKLEQHGFAHEYRQLSQQEVAATIGTDAYIGGLLNMGNGHLHPLNLCIGEAQAAVKLGTTIYEQSPVQCIDEGRKTRVVTAGG